MNSEFFYMPDSFLSPDVQYRSTKAGIPILGNSPRGNFKRNSPRENFKSFSENLDHRLADSNCWNVDLSRFSWNLRLKMFCQTETTHRLPKGPKNAVFCLWWPWPLTFDLDIQTFLSEGPTLLPCEFGANLFSGSRDISYANKKKSQTSPKTKPYAVHCVR